MSDENCGSIGGIGSLGCAGIDTDAWQTANRVPLYREKVNRWLLARTLRDDPSSTGVRETLNAVFVRWFKGIGVDVLLETESGARTNNVDGLLVVNAVRGDRPSLKHQVKRREDCTITVPTVEGSKGVLWIEVAFNYRGSKTDMPWPTWTAMALGTEAARVCPVNADWMLVEVSEPAGDAPPEQSIATIATELITAPAADVTNTAITNLLKPFLNPVLLPVWVGLGIWAYSKFKTR